MQQTVKHKLNLIESSDPFLPDALNANTRKGEAAMLAHEAAVQGEATAMMAAARLPVLVLRHTGWLPLTMLALPVLALVRPTRAPF